MKETLGIDEALERIPMGLFQYRMLLMCGFAFMADALEVNLLSFLATCAGDEWHLSNAKQASITGVVFAGIIVGSLWWGMFADKYGRKATFILVSVIITAGGFLTGAASSFAVLLIIRSIVGFGIGGASVPFDLLAEFMPSSHRGHFLIYVEYFWTIGSMFVTGLAWLCLDQYGWKVLAILTAIPVALTSLLSIRYLPESPRWLLANKKDDAAVKIIQKCALVNGHNIQDFSLYPLIPDYHESATYSSMMTDPAMRKVCIPLALVWMGFGFTYYGVILFISRIFSNASDDDGSSTCSFDYSSIFYNSLSELGGVTMSALVVGMGRVRTQTVFYCLSGVTVLFMGLVKGKGAILATSFLARMAIMTASNATWVATPELLPTELRTFGHAICVSFSKFGAFVAPYVVVSNLGITSIAIILCTVNIAAAALSVTLRETVGMHLDNHSRHSISGERDSKYEKLNPLHEKDRLLA